MASSAQSHTSEGSHHHRTREQAPLWQMAKNHESSLSPSLSLWHNGNTRSSHEVTETFSHFSPEGISASFLKMAEAGHSHPLSSCRGGRDDYLRKKAVPSHCLLLLRRFQKRNIERSGQALGDSLPCHRGKRQVWVVGAEKEPCEKESHHHDRDSTLHYQGLWRRNGVPRSGQERNNENESKDKHHLQKPPRPHSPCSVTAAGGHLLSKAGRRPCTASACHR